MPAVARRHRPLMASLIAVVAISCSRDPEVAKREYLASGNEFLSQNKTREAIVQYRNAVRQDPRFGEARYKLAEAYEQNNDLTAAAREFVRAADLLPNEALAQVKAGRFLLLSQRFEDAKTRANNALALEPANVDAQILLGNAMAGLKDVDGAVRELKEAIKLDPANTRGYVSLGAIERAAGRPEQAEASFKRAVEADPTSVAAHLALANFYWATRRPAEALDPLHLAFKLEPNHPLVNQMLAFYLMTMGRRADAEPYFKKLAEASHNGEARIMLADYYIASGRTRDAVSLLEQLVSVAQTRDAAELRLAELAFREARSEEAHKRLEDLLRREPGHAPALILKGRMLSVEGKFDPAITSLRAAVAADPTSAAAHFALGRAYLAKNDREQAIKAFNETARLNPRAVGAQLELSRLELAEGRVDSSIQLAEQALKNSSGGPDAKLALIRGLIARRDITRAGAELAALMKQYPDNASVRAQVGVLAAIKGDSAGATKSLTAALALDDTNLEALTALITLDLAQRNFSRAISRIESRLAQSPNDAASLVLAARTYGAAGDLKKSEESLRKAIEVDGSNFQAYGMLGRMYIRQGRLGEALREFDELSKRQPRPVQALTMVGSLLEAQNKPREARARYEQALAIDPEMPVAANNLAWMYVESGENLDMALQLAETAARRLPENPAIQDTLGWIYYKKGLTTLAVASFMKCIEREPRNAVFHFHLGLAYAKAGDSLKARTALQHALALEANFAGAAEAKQVLASLGSSPRASRD
jgi:cellulose synthase operon protein C